LLTIERQLCDHRHGLPGAEVLDGLQAGLIGQALHVSSILLALRVAGRLR